MSLARNRNSAAAASDVPPLRFANSGGAAAAALGIPALRFDPTYSLDFGDQLKISNWSTMVATPAVESLPVRLKARLGGLMGILAALGLILWRVLYSLPHDPLGRDAAIGLLIPDIIAIPALCVRMLTLWTLDPVPAASNDFSTSVTVFIPTYNESPAVLTPTIAAACKLEPAHETWVLDDGDREWVAELCEQLGARYVSREVHDHAKAGNINHALWMMEREEEWEDRPGSELIAILDCDHVPLPDFLTETVKHFADPQIALVQAPQTYYNHGAFDDDGVLGEQGVFFHVLMPSRNHRKGDPMWCGSTSVVRRAALSTIGGVATDTIVEDMHTSLRFIEAGWRLRYHDQTLAVGLSPETANSYLKQRSRWALGSMQVLVTEQLLRPKHWLRARNAYDYLGGTIFWLEGLWTLVMVAVPAVILLSRVSTTIAPWWEFMSIWTAGMVLRFTGTKWMFRDRVSFWSALLWRLVRIPIGLTAVWWLLTRRELKFEVTNKGGNERVHGTVPVSIKVLLVVLTAVLSFGLGTGLGLFPWHENLTQILAASVWLVIYEVALLVAIWRIRSDRYADTRRDAYRFTLPVSARIDEVPADLVDISVTGVAVRLSPAQADPRDDVTLELPQAQPIRLQPVRVFERDGERIASFNVRKGDAEALAALALWLFHTPHGAIKGLPAGMPAVSVIG